MIMDIETIINIINSEGLYVNTFDIILSEYVAKYMHFVVGLSFYLCAGCVSGDIVQNESVVLRSGNERDI